MSLFAPVLPLTIGRRNASLPWVLRFFVKGFRYGAALDNGGYKGYTCAPRFAERLRKPPSAIPH